MLSSLNPSFSMAQFQHRPSGCLRTGQRGYPSPVRLDWLLSPVELPDAPCPTGRDVWFGPAAGVILLRKTYRLATRPPIRRAPALPEAEKRPGIAY